MVRLSLDGEMLDASDALVAAVEAEVARLRARVAEARAAGQEPRPEWWDAAVEARRVLREAERKVGHAE